ncbi:hypothetical protein J6590_035261 [Homalodisca vitripennis]|nr:hypothetical protein J6590_035261 [Homalodisca vitripennis]
MDSNSDCDSVLSTDSLEVQCFTRCSGVSSEDKPKELKNGNDLEFKRATVPFYKGEVLVDEVKRKSSTIKLENKKLNFDSQSSKFEVTTLPQRASSFLGGIQKTNSARNLSGQRFSRRMEMDVSSCYSVKTRGRSVSYLDQFKKKIYGVSVVDSTTCSTVGSEGHGENLSCTESIIGSSRLSPPEFEFYEDLMANLDSKSPCIETVENIQSLGHKRSKPSRVSKLSKEKVLILPKLDVNPMEIINKKEIDKKKILQRRDEYANQVKLRNQFNINKQKEKDRKSKFSNQIPVKCHLALEKCHKNLSEKTTQKQKNNVEPVPFSFLEVDNTERDTKSLTIKKKISKANKTGKKLTECIKRKGITEDLSILQQRHEKEKSLVDSMRNLIIKT